MPQPIGDYHMFFGAAKQAVRELEELRQKEKLLSDLEKQLEHSLKTKQKQISETIALTVKKRSDEIAKSYDVEIAKTQDLLKKVRSKREKAKNQGEKERIADETQNLVKEIDDLKEQIRLTFRAANVPRYCASSLYYALYLPRGLKEFLFLLVMLLICFLGIPCGIYFLLPKQNVFFLAAIYIVTIVLFGGLYVVIGNATKMKHRDVLNEGRTIRNQMAANRKRIKKIKKSIRKDKNDSVYNLQKFDDEIAQLEQDKAQSERQKKEALMTFDTVTKMIISDEIKGNHKTELDQMESELAKVTADLKETQSAARKLALHITDHFEIYVGKEFMVLDKLQELEDMIDSGKAANISDALINFKSRDYHKNSN